MVRETGARPLLLVLDAAWRLGPRAAALAQAGKGAPARWWLARRLPGARPDPLSGADIRPLWEAHRWHGIWDLPDPSGFARNWLRAHPPFAGPLWACGQEAAIRALHLLLACALRGDAVPADALRPLLRRAGANPLYSAAQDNNHPVTEAAALWAGGLALGDRALAARGRRRLARAVRRLVSAQGAFSQPSPAYHRLLLDTAAAACWLAARHGDALPAPARDRLAAATRLLRDLCCPDTGALPRIGHQDGSAVADLAGAGPDDARPSLERAARLFCGASAGWPGDAGCARLGLPVPTTTLAPRDALAAGPWWASRAGKWRAVLRVGPLRFRPNHADLLHLELRDGAEPVLRDAGTGSYNPAERWWIPYFQGTAAHNTAQFDGEDQMPRLGPFLFARWPDAGKLPGGGWVRDAKGRLHERRVALDAAGALVEDRLSGPFREAALRWRLPPGPWRLTADGAEGPRHRLRAAAARPLGIALERGWHSPAYGVVEPCDVLVLRLARPGAVLTRVSRR